jgi:hypothetical protein
MEARAYVAVGFACLGLELIAVGIAAAAPARESRPARALSDGGSGTYVMTGSTLDFDLVNSGTTSWQYFDLVAPLGATFAGGATAGESTARCVSGQPDGLANEIGCGPLSSSGAAPSTQILFVAAMSNAAACGAPFELDVSSTGSTPYTRVSDVTFAGTCGGAPTATTTTTRATAANCDPQRNDAVLARARVGLLAQEQRALESTWSAASAAAREAEQNLRRAESADSLGDGSVALGPALHASEGASRTAQSALANLKLRLVDLGSELSSATAALARADLALEPCTRGTGSPAGAPGAAAANGSGCLVERQAVAQANARIQLLDDARRRFADTHELAAEQTLHAALAALAMALADSRPSAITPIVETSLMLLRRTDTTMADADRRFLAFISSNHTASAEFARAKAALASCARN